MNSIDTFVQDLRDFLPVTQIITNMHELDDTNIEGLEPRVIVLPENSEQVSRIVALTHRYGLTLLARGGGVRMSLGPQPERFDVLLDMSHLTRLLEHRADASLCRVEAGMMLTTLQTYLASKGQRLPVDPADAQQTSIGGLLSTDADGPLYLRYGSIRQWVDDVRVVQADGSIVSDKDAIGAFGTLGVIVEAQLKLVPAPTTQHTLLFTYVQASDAMNTILALQHSPLLPSAIELIDSGAANDLSNFFGVSMPTDGYTLALLVEGEHEAIHQQMNALHSIARTHNAFLTDDFAGERQKSFWEALGNHTQGTVSCKISLPVNTMLQYLHQLADTCTRYSLESALIAHAGSGILHVELRPGDAVHRIIDAIEALHVHAHTLQGTFVIERCPIDIRRRIKSREGQEGREGREGRGEQEEHSIAQNEWPYLAAIQQKRQQVDPQGTFARGRGLA